MVRTSQNHRNPGSDKRTGWKRVFRMVRRVLKFGLLGLTALVLILGTVVLVPLLRTALLEWGVGMADDALPGRLTVAKVRWPSLVHLVLEDALWVAGPESAAGDTLADVALVDLVVDLRSLGKREGRIPSLQVKARNLDVPLITATMASSDPPVIPDSVQTPEPPAEVPFLRPGSLPGLPSLELDRLEVSADRIRLTPDVDMLDIQVAGRADARPGAATALVVDHAAVRFHGAAGDSTGPPEWDAQVGHLGLGVTLEVTSGKDGGWSLVAAGLDSLNLNMVSHDLPQLGESGADREPVNFRASGRVTQGDGMYDGRLVCDFVLPGSRMFRARLPEDFPHEEFGRVAGSLTADGRYEDPRAQVALRLDLGSNTWLEKGVIVGEVGADFPDDPDVPDQGSQGLRNVVARLDTLDIAIEGIQVAGSGKWGEKEGALDVNLAVENLQLPGRVVAHLNPELRDLLEASQRMKLVADAGVRMAGEQYSGQVDCNFDLPGSESFNRWLPSDFPHQEFDALVGDLSLTGQYTAPLVSAAVTLDLGSNTWIKHFDLAGQAEADLDQMKSEGLSVVKARLDTLALDLGDLSAEAAGEWDAGQGGVSLKVRATDFLIPDLILDRLDPELRTAWADSDKVNLDAVADLELAGSRYSGQVDCSFDLPGSENFRPWLPENFPHEDFETLVGEFAVTGSYEAPLAKATVRLDLGANSWLDQGLISGSASADVEKLKAQDFQELSARIDTLEIDGLGILISAAGYLEPGSVELKLESAVTDLTLPLVFVDPKYADAEMDLNLEAAVGGSLENPVIDARCGGRFVEQALAVPEFDFQLKGDREKVAASLSAGGGLRYRNTKLDSFQVEVGGQLAALDTLLVDYGLAVWGPRGNLKVGGSARGDSLREVTIDSLVAVWLGEEMRLQEPVALTVGPDPNEFVLTPLDFSGEPGSVTAEGFWNDEGMDLVAGLDLLLGEDLLQLVAPSQLWSLNGGTDLKLEASAELERGGDDPAVVGRVGAALISHRDERPFGVDLSFTSLGGAQAELKAEFSLTSADSVLLKADLDWPGKSESTHGFWHPDPDRDLVVTVPQQRLDLKQINRRLPAEVVLNGTIDLGAEVHVFPPGKGEAEPDSLALIPLRGSISGTLGSSHLRMELPNRSWLKTVVDATLDGPLADPLLKARVEVKDGFIRIPEIPRNLLPSEGRSQLWALNDSLLAQRDTTRGSPGDGLDPGATVLFRAPEQAGPSLDPAGPALLPEMDVELLITNDLRIIGYGLDVKLLGSVKVTRGFDKKNVPGPSLQGDVRVREGSLKVMNRVFNFDRGNIQFTGGVPANPRLNLALESQVNTYLVRLLVSGRADNPVIELTSEPDLGEEDIMAVLLFGQPMNDLDNDQRGRMGEESDPSQELQKNLAGLAMAFGTKGLQDSMNETFGVDMVQMGSDSEGGSTLVVGKFITPDIMIKYNQSLEKSGTYFMTLEYTLTRYFKVMTTYGQGDEDSGAQLQWSRRY